MPRTVVLARQPSPQLPRGRRPLRRSEIAATRSRVHAHRVPRIVCSHRGLAEGHRRQRIGLATRFCRAFAALTTPALDLLLRSFFVAVVAVVDGLVFRRFRGASPLGRRDRVQAFLASDRGRGAFERGGFASDAMVGFNTKMVEFVQQT